MIEDDDQGLECSLDKRLPGVREEEMIVWHSESDRVIGADQVEEGSEEWKRVTVVPGRKVLDPFVGDECIPCSTETPAKTNSQLTQLTLDLQKFLSPNICITEDEDEGA
jgi:hypothetical protein